MVRSLVIFGWKGLLHKQGFYQNRPIERAKYPIG